MHRNSILLQVYLLHSRRYTHTYFLIYIYNIMYAYLIINIDFIRYYNKIGTEKPLILNTSQANRK